MIQSHATNGSQWQRLLLHLGEWSGSFTRLSPTGDVLSDRPSCVSLMGGVDPQALRQTVTMLSSDGLPEQSTVLAYRTLNRGILFFDDGAFSQGSLQLSPVSEFGAEFGFVAGDRRLRIVLQFAPAEGCHRLTQITLIREYRAGSGASERPALTLDQLIGTWRGRVCRLSPDWFEAAPEGCQLILRQEGPVLHQQLKTFPLGNNDLDVAGTPKGSQPRAASETLPSPSWEHQSTARIAGSRLQFAPGVATDPSVFTQVLLLPDGASCAFPSLIPRQRPFFLEVGWLVSPQRRYRLMRSYDAQGEWQGLTRITSAKIADV